MTTLRAAIIEGFKKAGWEQPTEDLIIQVETAVNSMDGRAANEGLKKQRREAAAREIFQKIMVYTDPLLARTTEANLLDIIERAQG